MGTVITYLDTISVTLSLFLLVGYHAYLWHRFKNKPSHTTYGIDASRRKAWLLDIKEGDDKKAMLAVQSLRNTQMATIFTASIAILVNSSLAALTNNAYKANHLLNNAIFGSQSAGVYIMKFGSASLFLLASFFCNSVALGCLIDANFLINASNCNALSSPTYTQTVFERGFTLAFIGNRLLCINFPLLMWMLGPVPVALSSAALVWRLYELDSSGKLASSSKFTPT